MNRICKMIITPVLLVLCSCGSPSNDYKKITKEYLKKTEIVTKTYSVKFIDGKVQKDTINMVQSIIVDGNGKEIANKFYDLDGSVSWIDEYKYNEQGYKIGSRYIEKDGIQTAYYEYDLDSLGRRIAYRAKDRNTDTLLYDGISKFLDNGKIRRDGYLNKAGEFKFNFEYQFDENGKELGYIYIDLGSGNKFPSIYNNTKLNDEGEWVERHIIENGKVNSIEIREFKKMK